LLVQVPYTTAREQLLGLLRGERIQLHQQCVGLALVVEDEQLEWLLEILHLLGIAAARERVVAVSAWAEVPHHGGGDLFPPNPLERVEQIGRDVGVLRLQRLARSGVRVDHLDEHRRRLTAAGIDAAATIAAGRPAAQILRQAEASGVDLIALATHGRSGLQAWTHGSVTEEVLHTTRTPLLLVRPGDHWPAAPHGLARVLVPLDGSEEAERALAVAEPLAARGLRLVLLRCVEPLSLGFLDPSGVPPPGMQPVLGMLLREAREYVADVAARLRARGLAVTTEVVVAAASDGVTAAARSAPGTIVVLASHARSGWRRFLLGSVARRVARLLPTPVVVCPAPHGAPRALAAAPGVSPIAGPGP